MWRPTFLAEGIENRGETAPSLPIPVDLGVGGTHFFHILSTAL